MEGLFESELKGQNGCRIYIVNSEGKEKEELTFVSLTGHSITLFDL